LTQQITNPKGGDNCDLALDVVVYSIGNLSIEADTLIFDPYKLTAIGHQTSQFCYVSGNPGYGPEDFQDMNQVTRRGTNWRNLISNGEEKSIEFSDGPHNCIAVQKAGPRWGGGYIYMLHASICRTDTATMRPEDVSYALASLQIRQYDPPFRCFRCYSRKLSAVCLSYSAGTLHPRCSARAGTAVRLAVFAVTRWCLFAALQLAQVSRVIIIS